MSIALATASASKTAPQGVGVMSTEGVCAGAGASGAACAAASTRLVANAITRRMTPRGRKGPWGPRRIGVGEPKRSRSRPVRIRDPRSPFATARVPLRAPDPLPPPESARAARIGRRSHATRHAALVT